MNGPLSRGPSTPCLDKPIRDMLNLTYALEAGVRCWLCEKGNRKIVKDVTIHSLPPRLTIGRIHCKQICRV